MNKPILEFIFPCSSIERITIHEAPPQLREKRGFVSPHSRADNSGGLRREIHEGLNVIENWNSANSFIFYGKGGEVATNQLEDQELSVLCLHLLQSCLVYVNTLMIQRILSEKSWIARMGKTDFRALSPLVYGHINPYGRFELDMQTRLEIEPSELL